MKAVIFDFNGTLFDDHIYHQQAWNQIGQKILGRNITPEELHMHMNGRPNHMIIRWLTGQEDPCQEQAVSEKKEALYRQIAKADTENFHLIKGAETLFDQLKEKGIPFTIASASIKPNIDFFVESFHLDRWIDPQNIVYDNGRWPDKVHMLQEAARILKTPVEEITLVEDSVSGVLAGRKAGIKDIRLIDTAGITEQVKEFPEITQICPDFTSLRRS